MFSVNRSLVGSPLVTFSEAETGDGGGSSLAGPFPGTLSAFLMLSASLKVPKVPCVMSHGIQPYNKGL